MTWLALAGVLALLPGRARAAPVRLSRPPLPLLAGGVTALLLVAVGGRAGLVLACPAAVLAGWGAGRASRGRAAVVDPAAAAFVLDLVGSALRAGAPAEWAIEGAATAIQRYGTSQLRCAVTPFATTGRLLRLGSDPVHAWTALGETPGLADVAAAGRRCAGSGAALADAFTDVAGQLRAQHRQRELARAARTGMWALLPLGCCFLPAFVCIGVVPVVLGVAGQVLPP